MKRYIVKKLVIAIITLLLVILILFLLMELMPGSPFNNEKLSEEQREILMRNYGLDKPLFYRYLIYVKNIIKGDFGVSYNLSINTPVAEMISTRMPVSICIGVAAMVLGTISGLAIGFFAAFHAGKIIDGLAMLLSIIGISIPSYIFSIILSYFCGFRWKILPLLYDYRNPFVSSLMAIIAESVFVMAVIAKFTRDEAKNVLKSEYVLFAKSQGLSTKDILFKYVIKNSLLGVITVMALLLVNLLTGSLVTEQIFSIPGIGFLLSSAIAANDYNVVIALSFVFAGIYVIARLLLDILYCFLDPRIRITGNEE